MSNSSNRSSWPVRHKPQTFCLWMNSRLPLNYRHGSTFDFVKISFVIFRCVETAACDLQWQTDDHCSFPAAKQRSPRSQDPLSQCEWGTFLWKTQWFRLNHIILLIIWRFYLQPDRSDVVQQFVEHRKNKIRRYISEIHQRFPIPIQCTVEASKSRTSFYNYVKTYF